MLCPVLRAHRRPQCLTFKDVWLPSRLSPKFPTEEHVICICVLQGVWGCIETPGTRGACYLYLCIAGGVGVHRDTWNFCFQLSVIIYHYICLYRQNHIQKVLFSDSQSSQIYFSHKK